MISEISQLRWKVCYSICMKKITIGIIAHVDSGKTTLSESILYLTNVIRQFGRVDKGASFFDDDSNERSRGITIYSKQARFTYGNTSFILIDTPGHSDFSAETERTLQVLDYAILLISAPEGIKGQTETLWRLLHDYQIPLFLFFNKMDQAPDKKEDCLEQIRALSKDAAVDFSLGKSQAFYEETALCSEEAMEEFLNEGKISEDVIAEMIRRRKLFPCFFGSALLSEGVEDLLSALDRYTRMPEYPKEFSARAYKIARAADGQRLTFVKITGGSLKAKTLLPDGEEESKINQIRFYSGSKYQVEEIAYAGDICALTGLKESYAGEGFGKEGGQILPLLMPILRYRINLPPGKDAVQVLPLFRQLEEESPELSVLWDEEKKELSVSVMGAIQLEILTSVLKERFHLDVTFDTGEVMYMETITAPVIGVGHFEPLRHYAEVHLLMEPLETGSGLVFASAVPTDRLAKNWQRLILTHLAERTHKGVLTGSPVTDMKITLINGKAHLKHTEGGDFRQAVYRAVRQGLMMTENALLEPFYRFTLELPSENVGRALNDLSLMRASFEAPDLNAEKGTSLIRGRGPVSSLKDYPAELASYTKGQGNLSFFPDGYGPCHNAEEVILSKGYDPLRDVRNTPDSVFCSHGAGVIVPYDEVYEHMHLDFDGRDKRADHVSDPSTSRTVSDIPLGTEEVDAIIKRVSGSNTNEKKQTGWRKKTSDKTFSADSSGLHSYVRSAPGVAPFSLEEADTIIVDGYNVIFAWDDLQQLAKENIDAARDSLIDTLSKLHSLVQAEVIVVFDAYRVTGHSSEQMILQEIHVVYTDSDMTADQYIERFTNTLARKKRVAVVTSDGAEQIITRGHGCRLISSRELKNRIDDLSTRLNDRFNVQQKS